MNLVPHTRGLFCVALGLSLLTIAVALVDSLHNGDLSSFLRAVQAQPALLNARGPEGSTPFMYAVLYLDTANLAKLLELGAAVRPGNRPQTPQVAAWQREEEAAARRVEVLRREETAAAEQARALRDQDPGAIRQWLVLAPIAIEGRDGIAALREQQIPQEASLHPQAGDRFKAGQRERVWRPVELKDYLIDFNQLLGDVTEWSVGYAVCYIQSEADQTGLLMSVGSDDQARVYLNGREVYRREDPRTYVPDQDVVKGVELKSGLNALVFKVVNENLSWKGSVRFTDAAGQPIKGIRVTLDPNNQTR